VNTKINKKLVFLFILLVIICIDIIFSLVYVRIHGLFLVSDGYFNYAVYLKNILFNKYEKYSVYDLVNFNVFPNKNRIIYPLLLATVSVLFNSSIITANYIINLVFTIFLFFLIQKFMLENNFSKERIYYYLLIMLTFPSFVIFSLKLCSDIVFTTFFFGSISFYLLYKKQNRKKYIIFSVIFTILAILTKELALILIVLYLTGTLREYKKSFFTIFLLFIYFLLISFVFLLITLENYMKDYFYWMNLIISSFEKNTVNRQQVFLSGIIYLFYWLFSPKSIGNLLFAFGVNFPFFIVISFVFIFYIYKNNINLIELSHIIKEKVINIYNEQDKLSLSFVSLYFLAIYVLQASYFNERYFFPISFLCYLLVFKLFENSGINFLKNKQILIFTIGIVINYLILLLRIVFIQFL